MQIVSWNIQWGRGADGAVHLSRTVAELRRIDADVICLQEVAVGMPGLPGGGASDGVARLREAFADHVHVWGPCVDVPAEVGGRAAFGNLILSRWPIGQVWRHLLPWPADPAVPAMQRGCIEAVVHAPGGALRVLTTHLEYYSARARLAQAQCLHALQREALDHLRDEPFGRDANAAFARHPRPAEAVLCGDFNCMPGAEAWAAVQGQGSAQLWFDAWPLAHGAAAHAPTVGLHGAEWPAHPYCCDFMMVSAALRARVAGVHVVAETAASDHQPVVLALSE